MVVTLHVGADGNETLLRARKTGKYTFTDRASGRRPSGPHLPIDEIDEPVLPDVSRRRDDQLFVAHRYPDHAGRTIECGPTLHAGSLKNRGAYLRPVRRMRKPRPRERRRGGGRASTAPAEASAHHSTGPRIPGREPLGEGPSR